MDKPDYLSWHFEKALPDFINSRQEQIAAVFTYFNIAGLLKNLFAPYRRLTAKPKEKLLDRLSFDIISRIVGAAVRSLLILTGLFATLLVIIFQPIAILAYLVFPFLSYPQYQNFKNNNFFATDLESAQKFLQKLQKTALFKFLSIFFEEDLKTIFQNMPPPASLKIKEGQNPYEIVTNLAQNWPTLTRFLEQKNLKTSQFLTLVDYLKDHIENPVKFAGIPLGQMLNFGYTNTLDAFSTQLTKQSLPASYPRKPLIDQIEKVINRPFDNNILLVGEPGVGRHTVLESLASQIQRSQIKSLIGRRVMLLDSTALAGTGKNMLEVKSNFEAILAEAKHAGNIILAIDNIDRITSSAAGRIDLTEVLTQILTDNSLPIIGITTLDEFNEFIRPNASLLKVFEKIDVTETSAEETTIILIGRVLAIYQKEKIATSLAAISEMVQKSQKLIAARYQPDKSIIILQDSIAEAKRRNFAIIAPTLVDEVISQIAKIPVGKITEKESEKLTNLEAILHKRVIGQDEAIIQIARALRRARAGIEVGRRPVGSFLFLGPTGVGKTETAKALAETYFGSEERMIRLDMSEFNSKEAIERLIGDAQTKMPGQLTSLVRQYPFSLLLIDEFEKAAPAVHNLFLQIFEEGFVTDAFGKRVSFDNIIIIATSNAAAEFIREGIASQESQGLNPKKGSTLSQKLIDYVLQKGFFSPELINRFDAVVVYKPLAPPEVIQVTTLMLQRLAQELKDTKNITLEISPELAQKIATAGYDPQFGARPIRRLIADRLQDGIARMIIASQIRNGDTIPATTLLGFVS
ncbi:ATP-dependent Clp protease ATP-binding subunit [Candidatus Curtissbacteria bacterium]|nr:ATP-dependent Clp protease ATP-binding subunit [Candidatus Curtissbacteria bacterium]